MAAKYLHNKKCLLGRTVPKIFIISLQEMGNYSSAQAAFFENILRGYDTTVNMSIYVAFLLLL